MTERVVNGLMVDFLQRCPRVKMRMACLEGTCEYPFSEAMVNTDSKIPHLDDVPALGLLRELREALIDVRKTALDNDRNDFDHSGHWEYLDPIDKILRRIEEFL